VHLVFFAVIGAIRVNPFPHLYSSASNSDLRTAKRRPALVIQRNALASGLDQTIVAMISSNVARRGHPSRVFIPLNSPQAKSSGLRLDSIIMTDNLATVLDMEIDLVLGHLEEMKPVDEAVKHTLRLS
jgi:mRNA interferase MazF